MREGRGEGDRSVPSKVGQNVSDTEKGICDIHAWKGVVRRFGLKEARRMLRLGLVAHRSPKRILRTEGSQPYPFNRKPLMNANRR
jgi:hypothetical protein